jgi:beta-lactamase regulating signal transducer with metallopeptidase domain
MVEFLQPGASLRWDLFWQSSLFLAIGLTASLALRVRPARAHRVLLLAMVAALVTPVLSQVIRHGGWGILRPVGPTAVLTDSSGPVSLQRRPSPVRPASIHIPPGTQSGGAARISPATAEAAQAAVDSPPRFLPFSWQQTILGGWIILSILASLRLVCSIVRGFRTVRTAAQVEDAPMLQALAQAARRLGLSTEPSLRLSPHLRCPSVWCWGRQPILLVPAGIPETQKGVDWVAVFCHELAHWRRSDHMAVLASQVLGCLVPWNPLAWWAMGRLGQLAELACDDWVLASGLPETEYAASLLELLPQRMGSPILAAVSSRSGLAGRMKHILGERRSSPTIGRGWSLSVLASTSLFVSVLALAQSGSASPRLEPTSLSPLASDSPRDEPVGNKPALRVVVERPDKTPVAHASVFWIGSTKPALGQVALPRDHAERRSDRVEVLAKAITDGKGQAELRAEHAPEPETPTQLIVKAPGYGLGTRVLWEKPFQAGAKVVVAPEVPIHGRLLTPAGQPAAGVRVFLDGFHNGASTAPEKLVEASAGASQTDDALPEYWPRPLQTDAEGRFSLGCVPPEVYATVSFRHPEFAVDEVTVSTVAGGTVSPDLKAFEIVPVKPDFTYTMEPARPVQGRVTDKETGKPLAGVLVEMTPMRRHGGMPFPGKTDADGQFRISGHATDFMYITSVFPWADSGYLATSTTRNGWPAGAKFLEVNFALSKGRLISGRVVNQDTKEPIKGAAVMYQPASSNPHNKHEYDLRNTVLTGGDGGFTITSLPGQGMLAVEVPDPDVIRVAAKGTMYNRLSYPHGSITLNIPEEGEPKPVEIAVRRGVTLRARVVDPRGEPVHDLVAFYPGISACLIDVWNQGQEFPDGIVKIRGADSEKTYRVWFVVPERKLGAVADMKFDPKAQEPIEVQLQPTASVHGKIATSTGPAGRGCQVYASLVLANDRKTLTDQDLFNEDLAEFYANILGQRQMMLMNERPKDTGEFTIDTLIPGSTFYVTAAEPGGRSSQGPVPDLKPGEDRDLGTLVLKERKP